jgi:hypothetical protein
VIAHDLGLDHERLPAGSAVETERDALTHGQARLASDANSVGGEIVTE